jgi:hypothetical protein
MENKTAHAHSDIEIEIEELESKIAPDGGETVMPLVHVGHMKH